MGTFIGHIIPGVFFMVLAIWNLLRPCFHSRPSRYTSRCHQFKKSLLNPVFMEGVVKVIATVAAAIGELWWGGWKISSGGSFRSLNNYQHATMYSFFGLAGLVELLTVTCLKLRPGLDKIFQATAFAVEGFLFYYHLHGRSAVDVRLHVLLVLAIAGCAVGSLLEALVDVPSEAHPSFFRYVWISCTILQGTWFIQTGFVLYNPWHTGPNPWISDELSALSILTASYAWHILLSVFITAFVDTLVNLCVRRRSRRDTN
ncbi:transmembrane protein 45B-like [Patiria miniata]|uniref:Transmembrane protein 45B n=1 Tax=Patiria miniata TaxID=46514 RepID=A0A913ZG78_PATMI|nr:transmembrane protein 45B-like [Patiria miniata]